MSGQPQQNVSNGIEMPNLNLPYPDTPEIVAANLQKLNSVISDPRIRFLFDRLLAHVHQFVLETNLTTQEWETTIEFLTRTGQVSTPLRREFILLSDILGISAIVDTINNPLPKGATEGCVIGPFATDDAPDLNQGDSISSVDKGGENLLVEGRVLNTSGAPIENATVETWEADPDGLYDVQYSERDKPNYRGRLHTGKDGKYSFRATVPVGYPLPGDGPAGELLTTLGRHNMRASHLHLIVDAPGYKKLVTALYPEGQKYLDNDSVFAVKRTLIVKLEDVNDETETRRRGFPRGQSFKLISYDFVLATEEEAKVAYEKRASTYSNATSKL